MTIVYTADIVCDSCYAIFNGETDNKPTGIARPTLAIAKSAGWSRNVQSIYIDLCPACASKTPTKTPRHAETSHDTEGGDCE